MLSHIIATIEWYICGTVTSPGYLSTNERRLRAYATFRNAGLSTPPVLLLTGVAYEVFIRGYLPSAYSKGVVLLWVSLQNFSIDIVTRQIEQANKKRLYTSADKYQYMVEKKPSLEEFRRRFNLDLD